jgi:hypothetical protein
MAAKSKNVVKPETEMLARKYPEIKLRRDDTKEQNARAFADMVISPELSALRVITGATGSTDLWKDVDVPSLTEILREQAAKVNHGDMSQLEAMLANQATALQSLFARLAERGMSCTLAPAFEINMRMALRAQNQCRSTLETLATIKNPPVFAKQANINQGNGNQQVNNGIPASHAGENINQQNELLEVQHGGEKLDTGATSGASGKDKAMAALD